MNSDVSTIFIMLGSGCNFNCKYCLQKPNLHTENCKKINDKIYNFVNLITSRQDSPLQIQFYGGEPFVYFDQMKEIYENLHLNTKLNWSVISNGSLIDSEKIEWLNKNNIWVSVSWDGRDTDKVRDFDVLKNKESRNNLLELRHLNFSTIISKYCYPNEAIDDAVPFMQEYQKKWEYDCSLGFDIVFDTGIENKDALEADPDKLYNSVKLLTAELKKSIRQEPCNDYYAYHANRTWRGLLNTIENSKKEKLCFDKPRCGNMYNTLNMDLLGNLYKCHNSDETVGSIDTYLTENYLASVQKHDLTKELTQHCDCSSCVVSPICKGGCPLVGKEARDNGYCDTRRAAYLPYIELLLELGQEAALKLNKGGNA